MKILFSILYLAILNLVQARIDRNETFDENVRIELENDFFAGKGLIQGFKRGFYKRYSYEIQPQCFGEEMQIIGFETYSIFEYENWAELYELPGFLYQLWLMLDVSCELEDMLYDIMIFCEY